MHLGRFPEAEAALQQAAEQNADDPFVLANTAVCSIIAGKDAQDTLSYVLPPFTYLAAKLTGKRQSGHFSQQRLIMLCYRIWRKRAANLTPLLVIILPRFLHNRPLTF